MPNVEKLSVALTPELAAALRGAVETGEYASVSEVMREALRDWRQRRLQRSAAIEELRRQWDYGLSSGDALDGPATLETIRTRLATRDPG
ncbi:type II toxin-antitoxin system ParD family antitoxin [Rhodobacter sp. CZR27]|uniref:ribbon-helix-helix domain-containing protein n=1 Tax=Rhodobacter sp. CZR27 TaxID=2033869 RepID=UPI000BBE511F|nr:type II toxin-antitoxin system ParD family antitoxin [Rhodobacter sp. CZR27]